MVHRVNRAAREYDAVAARKYRAESLSIVLRRVGQDDLGPHAE